MHYFDKETIMSRENALVLKPTEIAVLEHVRTYELEESERPLPYFIEIQCLDHGVVVKKKRIIDFPEFELEREEKFATVEEATEVFRQWIREME
ncbi:hypothetical protein ACQCN2_20755 [Brevibacillus ginsengisoli]|uniref:hypothetical protein n=1 Tax=Brevibacillus ginsengisoli TaxID=363854 RepID=UPI003CEBA0A2